MRFSIIKEWWVCKAQKDLPNFVQGNEQFDYFVIDFFLKICIFGRIKELSDLNIIPWVWMLSIYLILNSLFYSSLYLRNPQLKKKKKEQIKKPTMACDFDVKNSDSK